MTHHRIAWQEGEKRVQTRVENWLAEREGGAPTKSERLAENSRRVVYRLDSSNELTMDPEGKAVMRSLVVKIHLTHSGPHRKREVLKRKAGHSPVLREWQALSDLHAIGVPVPEPIAWGVLPGGDALIVTEYFAGRELRSVLSDSTLLDQLVWIDRLATSVELLHSAGFQHGDLHLGNLHTCGNRVMILDLQRARRALHRGEIARDLAHLDFAIARLGFDLDLRMRLRESVGGRSDLDRASRRFVRDFMRGRARREFRIGRAWRRWPETEPHRLFAPSGLRDIRAVPSSLDHALAAARNDPRPGDRRHGETRVTSHRVDGRSLVLKRSRASSRRRQWMERLRGSSARRGFRNGQRLALLGPLGARPLATLDEHLPGEVPTSWLILERVGRCDLDAYRPASEEEAERCAISLARWMAEWHAWGIDHLDSKAGNIRVEESGARFRFRLLDLEDVRFRRRLSDASRLRALVQLNASLEDGVFPIAARKAGLDAYLDRLPFKRMRRRELVESIARRSLARRHRWLGQGCEAVAPPPRPS